MYLLHLYDVSSWHKHVSDVLDLAQGNLQARRYSDGHDYAGLRITYMSRRYDASKRDDKSRRITRVDGILTASAMTQPDVMTKRPNQTRKCIGVWRGRRW